MLKSSFSYKPFLDNMSIEEPMRKTEQEIMPERLSKISKPKGYDIYPYHNLGDGKILNGISSLCDYIVEQKTVSIDGYVGVYWGFLKSAISNELISRGLRLNIHLTNDFMKK